MTSDTERRKSPRSAVDLPLTIAIGDPTGAVSAPAEIRDVSLSGVRCVTRAPVGMMTQVGLTLRVPGAGSDGTLLCRGAVVRCHKLAGDDDRYEAAIFFTSMAEADRVALQDYLQTVQKITGS